MTDSWTFLTNHAHVLLVIAHEPDVRIRDIAERVGITQRAVQRIVAELHTEGYIDIEKEGRRNRYTVRPSQPLRHDVERGGTVADLLHLVSAR